MSSAVQTFLAVREQIQPIYHFLLQGAELAQLETKTRFRLELACDEAVTNIIEHAYADLPNGEIKVTWTVSADQFVISLQDNGKPFRPTQVRRPTTLDSANTNTPERIAVGGLGIHFMRQLLDELHYEFTPNGNTTTMILWLPVTNPPPLRHKTLWDGAELITVIGRLDQSLNDQLDQFLRQQLSKNPKGYYILDLREVPYINSSGLRVIIGHWRTLRAQGGDLVVSGCRDVVKETLAMVGIDKIISLYESPSFAQAKIKP